MNIKIQRQRYTPTAIFGDLFVDGAYNCHTLERPDVAIPAGTYSVEMTFSPRFNRPLPLLNGVQNRTDIRIHAGNWPKDTEGCLLVGLQCGDNMILHSLEALNPLIELIQDASEPVTLSIA